LSLLFYLFLCRAAGYENPDGTLNQEAFFAVKGHGTGWFNTGDMGGVDEQGYLYISGRTKEIINRGGETISPFEIEEAVVQHPFIKEVLAFAAPHEQYQETIGVVVVTQKGKPRVDLPTLQTYLEGKLHRSKWPQVIVYSDSLPKNATGKILRIRFAERTRMKPVDEEAPPHTRLFEMDCPELGAPLNQAITLTPVKRDMYKTFTHLLTKKDVVDVAVVIMNLAHWQSAVVAFVVLDEHSKISVESLRDGCVLHLDQYEVPQFLYQVKEIPYLPPDPEDELLEMQQRESMSGKESGSGRLSLGGGSGNKSPKKTKKSRNSTGSMSDVRDQGKQVPGQPHARDITLRVDEPQLTALAIKLHAAQHVVPPRTPIEVQVELVWRSVLQLNGSGIGTGATALCVTTSFFDMGGDSLKAGQLVNVMRKRLQVHLTVADLFTAPTIEKISQKIATLKTLGTPDTSAALKQSSAARQQAILRERGRDRQASSDRGKLARRMRSTSDAINEAAGESTVWLDKGSAKIINTYGSIHEDASEHESLVDQRLSEARDDSTVVSDADPLRDDPFFSWDFAPELSSTSLGCLLVQALPITLIYPLRRIVIWFLIAGPWVLLMKYGWGR
jgi:aryl carrier-like protein